MNTSRHLQENPWWVAGFTALPWTSQSLPKAETKRIQPTSAPVVPPESQALRIILPPNFSGCKALSVSPATSLEREPLEWLKLPLEVSRLMLKLSSSWVMASSTTASFIHHGVVNFDRPKILITQPFPPLLFCMHDPCHIPAVSSLVSVVNVFGHNNINTCLESEGTNCANTITCGMRDDIFDGRKDMRFELLTRER